MKPFVTCVSDYHEFEIVANALEHEHNEAIEFLEIGFGYSILQEEGDGCYHAVFFSKGQKNLAKRMAKAWESKIEEPY